MAQDLTGQQLSDVYQTFLHTDTNGLSAGPKDIYSGIGEKTSLSLSTSSAVITGSLVVNNVTYPRQSGAVLSFPVMTSSNNLEFKTLNYILTSSQIAPVVNGTYSSATLTFVDGLISSATNTGSTKIFFIASRTAGSPGSSTQTLINNIIWPSPAQDDTAFIFQKVTNGPVMVDLTVYKFVYSVSNGWGEPNAIY
jgi:hypothetical protein